MWVVLAEDGPHWVCHSPRQHVLPLSTLLRLLDALQGYCPTWALAFVHFWGLRRSGSWVLCKGTDPDRLCVLWPSKFQAAQATGSSLGKCRLSHVSLAFYSPTQPRRLVSRMLHDSTVSGVPRVSSRGLISGCDTGSCQLSRIPRRYG